LPAESFPPLPHHLHHHLHPEGDETDGRDEDKDEDDEEEELATPPNRRHQKEMRAPPSTVCAL